MSMRSAKNDMVFSIGPAGTGKTYLAVAMAVAELKTETGEPNYLHATGGGGRGIARILCRGIFGRKSIRTFGRCTTHSTT